MPAGDALARLVDASAILSAEQQAHVAALHGQDTWSLDPAAASVTLTGPDGGTLVCRAHLLGTSAPGPSTWLWGWRNVNDFPAAFVALADRVRAAGEEQGVPELATAELPLTEDLPRRLTIAAKTITGVPMHYSGPIGGGSRAWLLLEHAALELPPPTARATADAILAAVESVGIADHREALASWARQRGVSIPADETAPHAVRLTLTDGSVLVTFDEQHRIARVEEQEPVGLDADAAPHIEAATAGDEPSLPSETTGAGPDGAEDLARLFDEAKPQSAEATSRAPEPEPPVVEESPMRRLLGFLRGPRP